MQNNFCVYKHTCPNDKVYIGVTSKKPDYRWGKNGSGYKKQPHFWRAIQKYGWENIKHEILFENLTKEEACEKEIELIDLYNSTDVNYGYNKSTGGEATALGYKYTEEQRLNVSRRVSGENNPMYGRRGELNPMYGKKRSEEVKEKMRKNRKRSMKGENNPFYGKHHKEEDKYWKGKHLSIETRKKLSDTHKKDMKPVGMYDKDTGCLVREFCSVMKASRETGANDSSIVRVCKGKQHICNGYVWKYLYKEEN